MTDLLSEITFCDECPYSGEPNGCNRKEGECKAHESYFDLVEENADLRERLDKAVEIPDYVFECINGKVERIFTEYLTVGELKNLEANGYSLTKEAAEVRLAEMKREK